MFALNFFFGNNREPLPDPNPQLGILGKCAAIEELKNKELPKERTAQLRKIGSEILNEGKGWSSVNWRQFALMHNASIIRHTDLEGGTIEESIEAWRYILKKWEKKEALFFNIQLSKKQIGSLLAALDDLSYFQSLLPHSASTPLDDTSVLEIAKKFQKALHHRLQAQGSVYLPLGYRHGLSNEGHAITCKLELHNDGSISFHPMNLGNGSESHPVLNYTTSQEKVSFRHFPFEIKPEHFWGEFGLSAFCHLIRYLADPPQPDHEHYRGEDLLDILHLLGPAVPSLGENPEAFETKAQRSGNCAEKGVHNVIHDVLIEFDFSKEKNKLIFLNSKLASLVRGYHSYKRLPSEKHRYLLKNGAEEFGVALQKMKPLLPVTEYAAASALVDKIKHLTAPKASLKTPDKNNTNFKIHQFPSHFPEIKIVDDWWSKLKPNALASPKIAIPEFNIATFSDDLDTWTQAVEKLEPEKAYQFLDDLSTMLPLPVWNQESIWDKLSPQEASQVIGKLEKLFQLCLKNYPLNRFYGNSGDFIGKVNTFHTFYIIIDMLTRKCPWTRLHGFASPFVPLVYNYQPHDFSSIPLGEQQLRYCQISDYFKKSAQEGLVIFPIEPSLSIEKYVYDSTHGGQGSQGNNQILFLQRHIYALKPSASNLDLQPLFFDIWLNMKSKLPAEVNTLYYFAYLSTLLFLSKGDRDAFFPQNLKFQAATDEQGKKALTLETYGQETFYYTPDAIAKRAQSDREQWGPYYGDRTFCRFRELDCHQSIYTFPPLPDNCPSPMTTNDAVCARLSEENAKFWRITEATYRDLLRISCQEGLKLPIAVHWATTHPIQLADPNIQLFLHRSLFAPPALYQLLKEEPKFIDSLREMVKQGLDYYGNNMRHLDTLLFLLRTGIFCETHLISLFGPKESEVVLEYYQKRLEKLLKCGEECENDKGHENYVRIKLNWLLVQIYKGNRGNLETFRLLKLFAHQDDENYSFAIRLLRSQMRYTMHPNDRALQSQLQDWLSNRKDYLARMLLIQLKEKLSMEEECHSFCTDFLQFLLPQTTGFIGKWSGQFPKYQCGDYTFNFLEFELEHCEKGKLNFDSKTWNKEGYTESLEGNFRQKYDEDLKRWEHENKILLNGESRWAKWLNFNAEKNAPELQFLKALNLTPYILAPLSSDDHSFEIVSLDQQKRPVLRIDQVGDQKIRVVRTDEKGNRLPIQLANLTEVKDKNDPLFQSVLRFSTPESVACFINTETGEIEELHFFQSSCQFKRNGKGLESKEYPGFYLQLSETVEELDDFQAAMVLANEQGVKKVLLPAVKLKSKTEHLTKEIELTNKPLFAKENEKSFFLYDLDPIDGSLHHKTYTANLYLALILKLKGNEVRALKYLKQAIPHHYFTEKEIDLLKAFTQFSDASPSALAFYGKLFFVIADNMNLLLENKFGSAKHEDKCAQLSLWGRQIYIDYLKSISREELSAIPRDLRLEQEEEKAILRILKRQAEKHKREFPQILQLRYKLLVAEKKQVSVTISPKTFLQCPPAFTTLMKPRALGTLGWRMKDDAPFPYGKNREKLTEKWDNLTLPDFPNRLSCLQIERHFPQLYERARHCQKRTSNRFDLILLACLKVKNYHHKDNGRELGHLLFYVRHFPHLFKDLSLATGTDSVKIKTFKEIVKRVTALEERSEFHSFFDEYLKKEALFEFTKEQELTLPKNSPSSPSEKSKIPEKISEKIKPFTPSRQLLFKREAYYPTLPDQPPFLNPSHAPQEGTIESEIIERFTQGYANLKKRKSYRYHLIENQLATVKKQLQVEKNDWHHQIIYLRQKITTQANAPYQFRNGQLTAQQLHQELDYRLRAQTDQNLTLLPEMIMKEVVLKNRPDFLKKHCPLLRDDEVEQLIDQTCHYYYLLTLYQISKECLLLIEKLQIDPADQSSIEALAGLLDYNFLDPKEYPEVFYFKVTEGKLPKKEQAEIYKWVCKALAQKKRVCFQHKAGGGKTDYLTPLFMLRAQREALMPVFLSTQMMYAIDKKNLSRTLTKLDQQLCYLEVGMHMKLSAEDFQLIFEQLEEYHHEGRSLIMTPQTYYALRLQYYFAGIKEKDELKVKYLGLILNFFESKCLQIGDESHRNYDPLTRAIFGIGDFFTLPKQENALFLEMMKPLLGFEVLLCNGKPISQVARLEKNLLGTPTPEEMLQVQKTLATYMSASKLLDIPLNYRHEFIRYWTDSKEGQPIYLKQIAKKQLEQAHLLALTGNFILNILPQIVRLRTELDHGQSIFQEEEFETPFHHKTPSAAQYEDCYLTTPLSIKGTCHRGLSEIQFRRLIIKLLDKDLEEQKEIHSKETDSALLFKDWILASGNPLIAALQLTDISITDTELMKVLFQEFSKNGLVLDYYLTYFILPQVGYCVEQLTVTPAHLMSGSDQSIIFSAIPLSHIYPQALDLIRYDPFFEAEVVTEICKEKNQHKIAVDAPEHFFTQMEKEFQEEFSKSDVFLDPKGFFCDLPNDEVAKKWLAASQLDGVLYFKEGRTLKVDKDEKICLLLRESDQEKSSEKVIELNGSNIKEGLQEHHLDWDHLRIGTYYDASHTESANILQKVGTTAFIFVGDNLSISRLIQALLRLRGLLEEKMIQNVIWVYPREVAKKIPRGQSESIDGAALFAWAVKNEAEELKKRIILKGFQEISFQIEAEVTQELKKNLHNPKQQIKIFQKYSKGLLEYKPHNPYASFGNHECENFSETVLMDFAKTEYEKYGYAIPFMENRPLLEAITSIIQIVKARIETIPTQMHKKSAEIEKQSHQIRHTQLHKQVKQKDYRPRPFEPLSAENVFGTVSIDTPNFPFIIDKKPAYLAFHTDGLTENFYFETNQLRTAKNGGVSMGIHFLKPIDLFLILLLKDRPPMAIAQCNEINQTMLHALTKECRNQEVKHQAFMVSASGKLLQRGKGILEPDEKKLNETLNSEWMQDLVIDAALLRGQIVHPDRLLQRIKKWDNFSQFWETIVKAQPNPETVNQRAMLRLLS